MHNARSRVLAHVVASALAIAVSTGCSSDSPATTSDSDTGVSEVGGTTDPETEVVTTETTTDVVDDEVAIACGVGTHRCGDACVDSTAVASCGDRCAPCPDDPSGDEACVDGQCTVSCTAGTLMCDGHCTSCPSDAHQATVGCVGGACQITACADGFNACDGACAPCPSAPSGSAFGCNGSACVVSSCAAGSLDCDGACAECRVDPHGTNLCAGASCELSCKGGYHGCDNGCHADSEAGACGPECVVCPTPVHGQAVCSHEACSIQCNFKFHACGEACAADSDATQCGDGCLVCPTDPHGSATCEDGQCKLSCAPSYHACGDVCAPDDDPGHCGGACRECPTEPGRAATCDAGHCGLGCPDVGFGGCSVLGAATCESATMIECTTDAQGCAVEDHTSCALGCDGADVCKTCDPLRSAWVGDAESDDVTDLLTWPGMVKAGDYVYVGTFAGTLETYDVSSPEHPSRVSDIPLCLDPHRVALLDGALYVACGSGGVSRFDLSDPAHPVAHGTITAGYATGVAGSGARLVVQTVDGLEFYAPDVSLTNKVGSFTLSWCRALAVAGDLVYAGTDFGLRVINVADPAQPVLAGGASDALRHKFMDLAIVGKRLYASDTLDPIGPNTSAVVQIYDLNSPTQPSVTGQVALGYPSPGNMVVAGNQIIVRAAGLVLLDASAAAPIVVAMSAGPEAMGNTFTTDGTYVYVADTRFTVAASARFPRWVGRVPVGAPIEGIATYHRAVYADGAQANLQVYDARDPAAPVAKPSLPYHGKKLFVSGHWLFQLDTDALRVFDLTDPFAPVLTKSLAIQSLVDVVVDGDTLMALGWNTNPAQWEVAFFDVRNMAHPNRVGTYIVSTTAAPYDKFSGLAYANGYLYIGWAQQRLTTPSVEVVFVPSVAPGAAIQPFHVTNVKTDPTLGLALTASGQELVAMGQHFEVFDLTTPSDPKSLYVATDYSPMWSRLEGRYLVRGGKYGVTWYDMSVPSAPVSALGEYWGGATHAFAEVGPYVYLGTDAGLYVIDHCAP